MTVLFTQPVPSQRSRATIGGARRGRLAYWLAGLRPWLLAAACAGVLLAGGGCWNGERATHPKVAPGKRLSLVEIGEHALDEGFRHEEADRYAEALEAYERAAWAFGYHLDLTGNEPLLMQDAQESARRVRNQLGLNASERR